MEPRRTLPSALLATTIAFPLVLLAHEQEGAPAGGGSGVLEELNESFARIAQDAAPGVVHVIVRKELGEGEAERRRAQRDPEVFYGRGSGFVLSADGLVATNHHVVGDAQDVAVELADGRHLPATVVGSDAPSDVALLRVEAEDLQALPLGSSAGLRVGEWVLAIGNPFGLASTVTAGIVSAKGRSGLRILDYEDFIQTDAAINPGNSGGPLLDVHGRVVGMSTAILSRSGGSAGIGLAIPIDMVGQIREQLLAHGSVVRGYLGAYLQELDEGVARALGHALREGVLVTRVIEGSPAERAGLRRDDVIVSFDGAPASGVQPLRNRVSLTPPGERVALVVERGGERVELAVVLDELDRDAAGAAPEPPREEELGLTVGAVSARQARRLGLAEASGVLVTGVRFGSRAYEAGLHEGLVILEVDRRPVRDAEGFWLAVDEGEGDSMLLFVQDRDGSRYVVLEREG